MKNLILLFISAFTMSLINAQETSISDIDSVVINDQYSVVKKDKKAFITKTLNFNYLTNIKANEASFIVAQLQRLVANFDIKTSSVYDNSEAATYNVVFKNNQGEIVATYNNEGKILSTVEKYEDVVIPVNLRIAISKQFPSWAFQINTYLISYTENNGISKKYKIKINKGKHKKTLKLLVFLLTKNTNSGKTT